MRYGIASSTANIKHFVGMTSNAAALGTVDPSTLANIIGFGKDSADTNYQFMYSGATTPATKIDTGIPANTSSITIVEIRIYVKPFSTIIGYSIQDVSTNAAPVQGTITGTFGTTIPATTTLMSPQIWVCNGASGGAAGIDVATQYLETMW